MRVKARSELIRQRQTEINKEFSAKHQKANSNFRLIFDGLLKKHGLSIASPMDIHSLPIAFHDELREAKYHHRDALADLAGERQQASARVGHPKLSIVRAFRENK